jgi:Histidine kinase-, DNA gyrase B-, and HSP90-like ATPase
MANATTEVALASPEKRLFISLLTRDIPLIDAFLDLIDNSINSAMAGIADKLKDAESYATVLSEPVKGKLPKIELKISEDRVEISDNSTGISLSAAKNHVFKFGRGAGTGDKNDRLSVYGVGLKRAIFKIGNRIKIESDHIEAGFDMNLNVEKWEQDKRQPWVIDINPRNKAQAGSTYTKIEIKDLYADVKRRINDGVFVGELRDKIQQAYAFFIDQVVEVFINDEKIAKPDFTMGNNTASDKFKKDGVECVVIAGIGVPDSRGFFVDKTAGWSIFCNGRNVVFADKSGLTGWSGGPELPLFQPKHRPFKGVVIFVSSDPELLPWTTTKSAINRESGVWQEARKRMVTVGKEITGVLDRRYDNDGTSISSSGVKDLAGQQTTLLKISTTKIRTFATAKAKEPDTIRIQFDAEIDQVEAVRDYLRKPSMSGSDVGRHVFAYFLKNRAGYDG